MDVMNIQALIAQGLITDVASVNPNKAYVAVGIFQPGNRQSGPAGNAYPSYAMPISEFLSGAGVLTGAQNGLSLAGTVAELGGTLIHTTDVNINGYSLQFSNGAYPILFLDPGKQQVAIGGNNPKGMLDITAVGSGTVGLQLNTDSTQDAKLHFRTNNALTARSQVYLEDASQTLNVYTVNSDTIFWNGNGLAQTKTLTLFTDTTARFESNLGVNGGLDPSYALTIASKATGAIRMYNSAFANMLTVTDAGLYNFSGATKIGIGAAASATNALFIEAFSALATDYSLNIASVGSVSTHFSVRNDGVSYFGGNTVVNTNGDGGLISNCTFGIVNNRTNAFSIYNAIYVPLLNVTSSGNVVIGDTLTPTSRLYVKGENSTSANYALTIDNSASSPLLYVRNDGLISAPLLPTSNTGLSTGDMYVDTAANILANGDLIVARKV